MKGLFSVLRLNFKQAIRDKIFSGITFFFFLYLAFCALLNELSPGESEKVLRSAGLAGIELTAISLIIFSFTFSFYRERDSRILEVYLSNFSRRAYLAGKLGGYLLITLCYLVFSGILYGLLLYFYNAFDFRALAALYPIFLKISIMIGFTSIFSCLFSSPLACILSSFFVYLAGESILPALKIVSASGNAAQKTILQLGYTFLPNMDKLDIKGLAAHAELPRLNFFLAITGYAIVYCLALWIINLFIFRQREY